MHKTDTHTNTHANTHAKCKIPKALREQVWIKHFGKTFAHRCIIRWCTNNITVFDFECGHDVPESKGGATTIENLRPLCSRCNKSMGNKFTIEAWQMQGKPLSRWCCVA